MTKPYPDFIETAHIDNFADFRRVGRDRWDSFERGGYRKLSTVLQKSQDVDWKRLYVYYSDLYILIQYISNYNEKYNDEITAEDFEKVVQENIDNTYINWKAIYDHINDDYRYRKDYLDRSEKVVLNVLFKDHKQLNQDIF